MLRILAGISTVLLLTSFWFYYQADKRQEKITTLEKTISAYEAKIVYMQTLEEIKADIDGVLKEYRQIAQENKQELSKQQDYLTNLGEQVRNDVSDYANNPTTASNVIDISWVYAYNRSTVRIPYAK